MHFQLYASLTVYTGISIVCICVCCGMKKRNQQTEKMSGENLYVSENTKVERMPFFMIIIYYCISSYNLIPGSSGYTLLSSLSNNLFDV